jgi:hypothetical protein
MLEKVSVAESGSIWGELVTTTQTLLSLGSLLEARSSQVVGTEEEKTRVHVMGAPRYWYIAE